MDRLLGHTPNGMGIANSAILACLLEHLVINNHLSRSEVLGLLDRAHGELTPWTSMAPVNDARDIISKIAAGFAQDRPQED